MPYVLIGTYGEYEEFTTQILGVFSSEQAARDAIPAVEAFGESQWKLHQERAARVREYLDRCTPTAVYPPGSPFPDGHKSYSLPDHEAAEAYAGPEVKFTCKSDDYEIYGFDLDAVQTPYQPS